MGVLGLSVINKHLTHNLSKMKEPLSRLQILSPISGGRLIELTPRHAYNDIWTLPSGEYFGKGYQVVATDGSLRLNQSSTKEPAMGAGVMWHDAAIPHKSERGGGQHSSTRQWSWHYKEPIELMI